MKLVSGPNVETGIYLPTVVEPPGWASGPNPYRRGGMGTLSRSLMAFSHLFPIRSPCQPALPVPGTRSLFKKISSIPLPNSSIRDICTAALIFSGRMVWSTSLRGVPLGCLSQVWQCLVHIWPVFLFYCMQCSASACDPTPGENYALAKQFGQQLIENHRKVVNKGPLYRDGMSI